MATNDAAGDVAEQDLGENLTQAVKLNESDKERTSSNMEVTQQPSESGSGDEDDGEEFYDAVDELNEEKDNAVRTGEAADVREDCGETDAKNEKSAETEQTDETDSAIISDIIKSTLKDSEIQVEQDTLKISKDESTDGAKDEQISEMNKTKELGDSMNEKVGDNAELQHENSKSEEQLEYDESATTGETDDGDVLPDQDEETSEEKSKPKPTTLEEDEDLLRELDSNMTDEEKEIRKEEAQELKSKGNEFYKNEEYGEAINSYVQALKICPLCYKKERAIMYSNRAACHLKMEEKEEAISDCSKAIELHPVYVKALLRRAQTYEQLEKLDEALGDYQRVVELEPSSLVARQACARLPEEIKERNEKLKEEMMGKLKDLGNLILRPFGLSTNNFQLQQNPDTGSYAVNFVQNSQNNGK